MKMMLMMKIMAEKKGRRVKGQKGRNYRCGNQADSLRTTIT